MLRLFAVLTVAAICLTVAGTASAAPNWRQEECRFKTLGGPLWSGSDVGRLIRCVSDQQGISPSVPMGIYGCETGHPYEYGHSDPYHGPLQYLATTFQGQKAAMPTVVRRYELAGSGVHNVRANLTTGIAWMARHGTYPWSGCD